MSEAWRWSFEVRKEVETGKWACFSEQNSAPPEASDRIKVTRICTKAIRPTIKNWIESFSPTYFRLRIGTLGNSSGSLRRAMRRWFAAVRVSFIRCCSFSVSCATWAPISRK